MVAAPQAVAAGRGPVRDRAEVVNHGVHGAERDRALAGGGAGEAEDARRRRWEHHLHAGSGVGSVVRDRDEVGDVAFLRQGIWRVAEGDRQVCWPRPRWRERAGRSTQLTTTTAYRRILPPWEVKDSSYRTSWEVSCPAWRPGTSHSLDVEPHQPQVLRSDAETRVIAINLPAGEAAPGAPGARARLAGRRRRRGGGRARRRRRVRAGTGFVAHFDPNERHEVRATSDARLLLFLAPWPGEGHPSQR